MQAYGFRKQAIFQKYHDLALFSHCDATTRFPRHASMFARRFKKMYVKKRPVTAFNKSHSHHFHKAMFISGNNNSCQSFWQTIAVPQQVKIHRMSDGNHSVDSFDAAFQERYQFFLIANISKGLTTIVCA